MTYKIYLKTDYKPSDRWTPKRPWYKKLRIYLWAFTGFFLSFAMVSLFSVSPAKQKENVVEIPIPSPSTHTPVAVMSGVEYTSIKQDHIPVSIPPSSVETVIEDGKSSEWKTIHVAPGDSLSLIFDRIGLSPAVLYQVVSANSENTALKHLLPRSGVTFSNRRW